eukprot:259159_1
MRLIGGKYTLNFDTSCRDGPHKTYCADDLDIGGSNKGWLAEHESIEDGVSVEAKLTWKDDICDPKIFDIQFEATMGFYTSDAYKIKILMVYQVVMVYQMVKVIIYLKLVKIIFMLKLILILH